MRQRTGIFTLVAFLAIACSDSTTGPELDSGGEPAWEYLNPIPTPDNLIGVVEFDDGGVLLVSVHGAYRSTDNGETWSRVGPGLDGFGLDFYRRGDLCAILTLDTTYISTDAGRSWLRNPAHNLTAPEAIAFFNPTQGIIVGKSGLVRTTDDGGRTWTPRFSGSDKTLSDVEYFDSDIVIIGGDHDLPLRSTDRGVTWTAPPDTDLEAIWALDITDGIIRAGTNSGNLFTSTDSGDSYTQSSIPDAQIMSLDFEDVVSGIAGTRVPGGLSKVYRTANGIDWMPSQSNLNSILLYGVSYGKTSFWAAGLGGRIYRSNDGGVVWTLMRRGFTTNLRSVSFADANVGLAVGTIDVVGGIFYYCGIIRTTDGGRTWTRPTIGNSGNVCVVDDLNAVYMIDSENAVIAGDMGELWTSGDGGVTWTRRDSKTSLNLYTVSFADANRGAAAGEFGQVRITNDGGATWEAPVGGAMTNEDIRAVDFASPDVAMLVGDGGIVRRTEDGGQTWMSADNGISVINLFDIAMLNDSTAVAIGQTQIDTAPKLGAGGSGGTGTVILRTTDGGQSWDMQQVSYASNLGSVAFGSETHGFASNVNGYIFLTEDGGRSWECIDRESGIGFRSMWALDEKTAFVVGAAGGVMVTTSGGR